MNITLYIYNLYRFFQKRNFGGVSKIFCPNIKIIWWSQKYCDSTFRKLGDAPTPWLQGSVPIPLPECPCRDESVHAKSTELAMLHNAVSIQNASFSIRVFAFTWCSQRPLLIVIDRNMDLATPLHHPWTYQSLVLDLLVSFTYPVFSAIHFSFFFTLHLLILLLLLLLLS